MLAAFVDESERDESFYFLGAVICDDSSGPALVDGLDNLMQKHAATFPQLAGAELHGSAMMRANEEPWRSLPLRVRLRIYEEAFEVIASSGARIYIEGVDVAGQRARGYPSLTPARELAFSHIFERINGCWRPGQSQIRVIADEHHTAEISRSNFSRYQEVGTYGYRSSTLRYIFPHIAFRSSAGSRGLQAADLVTYIYNRLMTVEDRDARADAAKRKLWAMLEDCSSHPNGRCRIWP